jgi:hypothetical protein
VRDQLRQIKEDILDDHVDDIERLRRIHDLIVDHLRDFDVEANEVWSVIAEELHDRAPDLTDFEKPKPRPAQESDEPALYDSKRDPLRQLDHYHDWQRR